MNTVTSINNTEAHEQIILTNPYGLTDSDTRNLAMETRNPEVLAILSKDDDVTTRENVAANPFASAETLTRLAVDGVDDMDEDEDEDECEGVRNNVAANPNTPAEVLEAMLTDELAWDYFIAQNPNATAELLDSIATTHGDDAVNDTAVAENPNTSIETLERLANGYEVTKLAVARNSKATAHTLSLMSVQQNQTELQEVLARHPQAGPRTLDNVARATLNDELLEAIARNPLTHQETISYLVRRHRNDANILRAIREREAQADAA